MLIPLSALSAFRQDLAAGPDTATSDDARWLQVVTLLQNAVDVPAVTRGDVLDVAADLADPDIDTRDGVRTPLAVTVRAQLPRAIEAALRSAIAMEDAARFQLAFAAYDAVLRLSVAAIADPAARAEVQAVVLALQGRVARQLGDAEAAKERYAAAESIGREAGDRSILARAWIGYGILAQVRGNLPDARKWFTQVLSEPAAARESRQVAHQSLMVASAAAGDFVTAAEHGWSAYELAGDADDAAAALCDLSELMRVSGRPRLALRGFSAALHNPITAPRRRLPALGGAAMSAAEALGQGGLALVRTFHRDIEGLIALANIPLEQAKALADLGDAYAVMGEGTLATELRSRVATIAQGYGFFELLYRVTEGAIPVRKHEKLSQPSGRGAPSLHPMDGAQPVLDAIAQFAAPAHVEAALALQSA